MSQPHKKAVYKPPSSEAITQAQNTTAALRLLLAQRRLYSKAKRWAFLRTIGISVIAVAAPIVTALYPKASVLVGAVATVWIFLSRTIFVGGEHGHSSKGAEVQEQFDVLVFSMPQLALRDPRVTPEEISDLVGTDTQVLAAAKNEKLLRWYPVDIEVEGSQNIAIAQRANAAYSERLLNSNANVWLGITLIWTLVALSVGIQLNLSYSQFLLGVAIPLLPALLDVYEQWRAIKSAGRERRAIADGIERLIREEDKRPVAGQDLLVWQDQLYGLRRKEPQVPNLVYKRTRKKNELAMKAAASELATVAKENSYRLKGQGGES